MDKGHNNHPQNEDELAVMASMQKYFQLMLYEKEERKNIVIILRV
jgi:hypothetical protein